MTNTITDDTAAPIGSAIEGEDRILVLDFGGQTAQLIARRVRDQNVFCQLVRHNLEPERIKALKPKGIILSGGPASVYGESAPQPHPGIFDLDIPILGICYGLHLACHHQGNDVRPGESREFGRTTLKSLGESDLFKGIPTESTVWMSHGDQVEDLNENFVSLAATETCPYAAVKHKTRPLYGMQFHPEVTHSEFGGQLLSNFVRGICGCEPSWHISSLIEREIVNIRERFIDVFRKEAESIENARFLAQGTLYPDVIESGANPDGPAATIKAHHNVGGLPEELGFELIEPLRDLFKDEVRKMGEELGLPEHLVWRHPFPGPGLAVRCLGEITEERLVILREADSILIEELYAADLYRETQQAFVVLLPVQSVGVMGDARTYENCVAIRAVKTDDFMTADWYPFESDFLRRISTRLINSVRGINRVVYDISSKPPSTIEWE
ncbi:UNVERIFIED_CONTAM: hypothetical protein GTU68_006468 [Idotea baltica]|nr:hypothetical protein [Idotea baltica]